MHPIRRPAGSLEPLHRRGHNRDHQGKDRGVTSAGPDPYPTIQSRGRTLPTGHSRGGSGLGTWDLDSGQPRIWSGPRRPAGSLASPMSRRHLQAFPFPTGAGRSGAARASGQPVVQCGGYFDRFLPVERAWAAHWVSKPAAAGPRRGRRAPPSQRLVVDIDEENSSKTRATRRAAPAVHSGNHSDAMIVIDGKGIMQSSVAPRAQFRTISSARRSARTSAS